MKKKWCWLLVALVVMVGLIDGKMFMDIKCRALDFQTVVREVNP
ncbi:hypothetical protein [Listeria kieliensis]|nr:hypothetical protein [Listeria kieliensis]